MIFPESESQGRASGASLSGSRRRKTAGWAKPQGYQESRGQCERSPECGAEADAHCHSCSWICCVAVVWSGQASMRSRSAWHATATRRMTDANGHSIAVDGKMFGESIHGSLKCNDCHANIKEYPHPEQVAKVECKNCHADQATALAGSVHARFEGSSVHELPRQRAYNFSEDRLAFGCVSAQCSEHLRTVPQQ